MENISKSGMIKPTKSRIRRFTFYYYLAYYPTRFKVSDEFVHRRRLIWDFKEGKNSLEVANSIKADIDLFKLKESLNEWWLCVIPASTEEKTKRRFKSFCKEFVKDLEINNGYKIISVKEDREAIHLAEDRGS